MSLSVIRVDGDPVRESIPLNLGQDVRAALVAAKAEGRPIVFIIAEDDVTQLQACGDLIISRGNKHPAKALAPLLLGQQQIPFVRGGYTSTGQLLRSVRRLLQHAQARGDNNLFLISANTATFAELRGRAHASITGLSSSGTFNASSVDTPTVTPRHTRAMIELLQELPVPDVLLKDFIGSSIEVRLVRQLIVRAAATSEPALVLGDTGTGKEVVARLIHALGPRRAASFIPVNCGAIPRDLFESELFGYEKGAFTNAVARKVGLWRTAHGGTLFLDEIADLSLDHQVKILRVLDSGEILPVGAEKHVHVDARVLTATNRDLFAMVRSGHFREDLYYRLRAFMIRTPPLGAHPEDIPAIAQTLWKKVTRDPANELTPDVLKVLSSHGWPGNVRELKAFLSSVANLFGPRGIKPKHLAAVFDFERLHMGRPRTALPEDVNGHRLQCLRHLRQVDEVLRAAQVPLRSVMKGREKTAETFAAIAAASDDRVNELEVLCAHPLLFHSAATFGAVRRLKEKLREFAETLRTDPERGLAFWKSALEPEFTDTLTAVFDEVDRVVKGA